MTTQERQAAVAAIEELLERLWSDGHAPYLAIQNFLREVEDGSWDAYPVPAGKERQAWPKVTS